MLSSGGSVLSSTPTCGAQVFAHGPYQLMLSGMGYVRDEKVRALWGQKVENFSVWKLASGHGLQVQDGGGC